jgi:hypothetical protein
MSPPLLTMVAAALLLWGARAHRFLVACACTTVLTLVTAVASLDEVEGFSPRPAIYTGFLDRPRRDLRRHRRRCRRQRHPVPEQIHPSGAAQSGPRAASANGTT